MGNISRRGEGVDVKKIVGVGGTNVEVELGVKVGVGVGKRMVAEGVSEGDILFSDVHP